MKYLRNLYMVMMAIVLVNLTNVYLLNGDYSGIASWIIVMLFLFGTIYYCVARFYLAEK
ncbi:hypothetical protein [Gracilibacillus suaedae]|uniref:hypothetical protein n=1 Tax=Gracilibacillus suaedae TaxID=2820273 RepID=UPI001ABDA17E|nr:hypothetical protein [Gracilibacillus suaedae]